jgi:hypothetical protein
MLSEKCNNANIIYLYGRYLVKRAVSIKIETALSFGHKIQDADSKEPAS